MYVINISVPDHKSHIYIPTRLVVGCGEQAIGVNAMLQAHGIDGEVVEVDHAPERSDDEKQRAVQLMALLFAPVAGSA